MLRALALVSVRQQKNNAAGSLPFRFRTHNKLVDDYLSAIHKITELRLPKAQHVGKIERIPIVEPQNGRLRQHAVVDTESGLLLRQICERYESLTGYTIVKNAVPLTESPTPAILSGQANRGSLNQKRSKSQRL